jgi:hypothetical protein
MTKTAQITKCEFTGDWKAPNGDMIHYHQITLNNGDIGAVGTAEKYAPKIAAGATINYTIQNGKIKIVADDLPAAPVQNRTQQAPAQQRSTAQRSYGKKPEDFLGYCCGYAKDLVVAGKADKKSLDLYKHAAAEIYKHCISLLQSDNLDEQ